MGERRRPHPAPSLPARAATTPAGAAERRRQRARRQRVSEGSSRRAERDGAGEGRGSWSTGARRARRPGRLGAVAFGPAFRVKRCRAVGASVIARSAPPTAGGGGCAQVGAWEGLKGGWAVKTEKRWGAGFAQPRRVPREHDPRTPTVHTRAPARRPADRHLRDSVQACLNNSLGLESIFARMDHSLV